MEEFLDNLKICNKTIEFYLNHKNIEYIKNNKEKIKILNKLINSNDFDNELKEIILSNPKIISIFPLLIASKESRIELLLEYNYSQPWVFKQYSFDIEYKNIEDSVDIFVEFFNDFGLKDLFQNKEIEDVYSYLIGVNFGINSNRRKNISGEFMETYIDGYLKNICKKNNLEYLSQATYKDIKLKFNIDIINELKNKKFDFVINNNGKLIIIESNFYNSSGSKIKSVAKEYINLNQNCNKDESIQEFIWITDGYGWKSNKKVLEEVFRKIDNVVNIENINNKFLEKKLNIIN